MKLSSFIATALLFSTTSAFAAQDILIENHTGLTATAKLKYTLCSSILAGDKGILKPHQNLVIPSLVEEAYCRNGCNVDIYASTNCSGPSIFTVHIDLKSGVNQITSHTTNYHVAGAGHDITVESGARFGNWLHKLMTF